MESNGKKIVKQECLDEVWERVELRMRMQGISQTRLVELCKEAGYMITQPEISKLKRKKCKITLYQTMAFSEALDTPLEHLIKGKIVEEDKSFIPFSSNSKFVIRTDDQAFKGILGTYNTIFHSTSETEDKWLKGILHFKQDRKHICRAEFILYTGEKDEEQKEELKKIYRGQVIISKESAVIYCILVNDTICEMCFLELHYRTFRTRKMACRMGMALTVSSGEHQFPTVHKIFLSRKEITDELLEEISPVLRMNRNKIEISRRQLMKIKEENPELQVYVSKILEQEGEEYYCIENRLHSILARIGINEERRIMELMKEYSREPYALSLTEAEESYTFWLQEGKGAKDE